MIRSALAAAAVLAAAVAVVPGAANAAQAPSAEITSCTFAPAGSNVAKIAIRSAGQSVRWSARWIHTDPDQPDTHSTSSRGVVATGSRIIQLRYTNDDLVKFVAKSGDRVLLSVRLDTADGCGVTSTG